MAERVVLHVGCLKSGTSFIQRTLLKNPETLAAQGYLFPGRHWRAQVAAVIDLRDQRRDGVLPDDAVGAWERLRREIAAAGGTAIVSMEFLASAPAPVIERIRASLAPARVEAILTVRDLGRTLPSMWQEAVKNGSTVAWEDYAAAVRAGDRSQPGPARNFWRHQGATPIARRWARGLGLDRFTLITVPPPGAAPGLLWQRFCTVAGLDPAPFTLPAAGNESLGAPSVEVVRDLNQRLAGALATDDYNRLVKRLAKKGLAPRRGEPILEPPIGYDDPWVGARAEVMIGGLTKLSGRGVRVQGDLEDLRPAPVRGVAPGDVPAQERLDSTVAALAHTLRMWPTA